MRTVLFINTHSRRGAKLADEVITRFNKARNFEVVETIIIDELNNFDNCLKQLHAVKQLECVVVGSGDGTIIAVLNALKGRSGITYAFLPLGTSNTFVRSLGLPVNLKQAIDVVLKRHTRHVSLGTVNDVLFANIAGIGLPVRVSKHISNRMKRYLGPLAYFFSGVRQLIGHNAMYCSITSEQGIENFYTHHLLIANGPYHGHLPVSKRASLFKDQLVLVAFGTTTSRWQYAKSMLSFARGKHAKDPSVRLLPFKQAHLSTTPKRAIEVDGEIIGTTPAEIKIIPKAIKVFTNISD